MLDKRKWESRGGALNSHLQISNEIKEYNVQGIWLFVVKWFLKLFGLFMVGRQALQEL